VCYIDERLRKERIGIIWLRAEIWKLERDKEGI
jgi:hypothetical protein